MLCQTMELTFSQWFLIKRRARSLTQDDVWTVPLTTSLTREDLAIAYRRKRSRWVLVDRRPTHGIIDSQQAVKHSE